MADRHAPQGLARLVSLCEETQLAIGDAHGLPPDQRNRASTAVHVKLGQSARDRQDLHHGTIPRWNPHMFARVVIPGWNSAAHGESQEVLHVMIQRLGEVDHLGTHGQRLVHRVVDRVGVRRVQGQGCWHGRRPRVPHRVLRHSDAQGAYGHGGAVGQVHGGLCSGRHQHRGLSCAVAVGDHTPRCHLQHGLRQVHHRDLWIGRDHDDVVDLPKTLPWDLHWPVHRQVARLRHLHRRSAAAVDYQVIAAVGTACRGAELGMAGNRHLHSRQRRSVTRQNPAADSGGTVVLNGSRGHAGLARACALVDVGERVSQVRDHGRRQRGYADARAGLTTVRRCAVASVVAGRAVGLARVQAHGCRRIADAGRLALIPAPTRDRVAAHAGARDTGIRPRTEVIVVTGGSVCLVRV